MELEGKRIIVTGSARGMGEATLRAYVNAGAHVIGMDVNDETGASIAHDANKVGPGEASYLHVDIADISSVESAFSEAVRELGGLDALAHPAAIQRASDASNVTTED